VMIALFGLFAEVERDLISERTKEGLAAVRAQGRLLGRPKGSLVLQRKEFDVLVPGHPGLGVGALSDFVATDVVIHQQQSQVQRQPADLHRSLEQPHGPVQRQLRRFFLRSRRVRVMNR
jgi:Resolvase, N terminal domain